MATYLNEADRETVRTRLQEELEAPVHVKVFSEPASGLYVPGRRTCLSCRETEELMNEVTELSDRLELEIRNVREDPDEMSKWGITFTPTIAIYGEEDSGVRFLGLPAGFEFSSFLETVISAGRPGDFGLSEETRDKLQTLDSDIDLKVFSTPT